MEASEACMSISPFLSVEVDCDKVLEWTVGQLAQIGLQTMQTFDLNTARASLRDCPCPDHGTNECDCQMVILFVYGQASEPVALILHGKHKQTWLSFAETPISKSNTRLAQSIQQQLESQASEFQTP
jgi:hypothetical protein